MEMEPVSGPNLGHCVGGRHSTARSSEVSVSRGVSGTMACSASATVLIEPVWSGAFLSDLSPGVFLLWFLSGWSGLSVFSGLSAFSTLSVMMP